jgi:hypothetical protein
MSTDANRVGGAEMGWVINTRGNTGLLHQCWMAAGLQNAFIQHPTAYTWAAAENRTILGGEHCKNHKV